jgi:hypothetical protein
MKEVFNWICPYCNKHTTIVSDTNFSVGTHYYKSELKDGCIGLCTKIIICPNPECKEYTIEAFLYNADNQGYNLCNSQESGKHHCIGKPLIHWRLKPQTKSIHLPDYIPQQIRDDYMESCLILSLSPKASATLARRCLQGIIRDFWGISKSRLVDEIKELQNKIDPSTWSAIDAIRSLGNIGAHMEKDVGLIIDIDEDEAAILVKLIEDLFYEWYIARHEREERNRKVLEIAAAKKEQKQVEL